MLAVMRCCCYCICCRFVCDSYVMLFAFVGVAVHIIITSSIVELFMCSVTVCFVC